MRGLNKEDIFNLLYAPDGLGRFSFRLVDEEGKEYDRVEAKEAGLKYFNDKFVELGDEVVAHQAHDFVRYLSSMLKPYTGNEDLVAWLESMGEEFNGKNALVYKHFKVILGHLMDQLLTMRKAGIKKVKANDVLPTQKISKTDWVSKKAKSMAGKLVAYVTSEIAIPGTVFAGGLGKLAADTAYAAADLPGADMLFFALKYRHGRKPVQGADGKYHRQRYVASYRDNVKNIELIVDDQTGEASCLMCGCRSGRAAA